MKNKLWLNAALLAAVIALALFAWLKPQKVEAELKLSALKAGEVDRIGIEIAGAGPIALERAQAGWLLTAPVAARADDFQVQRLLVLSEATAKERFPATGLARFDLNEPYARVTLNQQSFSFGAVNPMGREQYVLTQGGVYLVGLRYGAALPKDALQLASRQLFAADEAPVRFEFKEYSITQSDGKWNVTPQVADLSQDDINRWVDEWRQASALRSGPYANNKPVGDIKLEFRDGKKLALGILQREPELVLLRPDENLQYHFLPETAKRLLTPPRQVDGK